LYALVGHAHAPWYIHYFPTALLYLFLIWVPSFLVPLCCQIALALSLSLSRRNLAAIACEHRVEIAAAAATGNQFAVLHQSSH
jgi:hypothetical protein